ncbi:hypothetical protein KUCAC02_032204, partial [Chaenocephalus aceratus]
KIPHQTSTKTAFAPSDRQNHHLKRSPKQRCSPPQTTAKTTVFTTSKKTAYTISNDRKHNHVHNNPITTKFNASK